MAVNPLQRIGGCKRKRTCEHLVQSDTQRVEIAASIDRAIHAARLFGRHICESTRNDLGRSGHRPLLGHPRGNAKAGEPDMTGVVDEDILRLDVFMYQTAPMEVAKRYRQANRELQKANNVEWLLPVSI